MRCKEGKQGDKYDGQLQQRHIAEFFMHDIRNQRAKYYNFELKVEVNARARDKSP